jgi:hypothetical protein
MTEQQPYEVLRRYAGFEVRRYPPCTVAEVEVTGSFERAGSSAFRYLFGYISGANTGRHSIEMTAPVVQRGAAADERSSEKIPMTAPVLQRPSEEGVLSPGGRRAPTYRVAFVLPAGMTELTAPTPADPRVRVLDVPGSVSAALRFSGSWSRAAFAKRRDELEAAIAVAGLTPVGPPRFARFDPPFVPWFLRRNEVVQDLDGG